VVFGNMLTDMVSQIPHANNMLLWTSASKVMEEDNAKLWIFAKTASHHHAQLERHANQHAKPLISRNTTSVTITTSEEPLR